MADMKRALLSLSPLVAGVAIAAWPASEYDFCQLQITYWDQKQGIVRDRGYLAVDEDTGRTYKTGPWLSGFQNGKKLSSGDYRNNLRHGTWTFWFQSGQKRSEMVFADGRPTGKSTSWHPSGQKSEERIYGETELRTVQWHENGQKSNEGVMKGQFGSARMHGVWTRWYPNGQKRSEATYDDGKLDGVQTFWDEQGNVTSKTTWKNGEQIQ